LYLSVGDALGYVLAWSSLLPVFMCIVFITLIIIRRDLFTVSILFCYFSSLLIDNSARFFCYKFFSCLVPLPLTISCSSKSRFVLTFLVLPFWYLVTQVVPNKFQKSFVFVSSIGCFLYFAWLHIPHKIYWRLRRFKP